MTKTVKNDYMKKEMTERDNFQKVRVWYCHGIWLELPSFGNTAQQHRVQGERNKNVNSESKEEKREGIVPSPNLKYSIAILNMHSIHCMSQPYEMKRKYEFQYIKCL